MFKIKAILFILCLLGWSVANATTYTVNSGQSTGTIQGVINGAVANDTVSFSAGTYSTTSALTLKCGVTYTGPVATPSTVILASTFSQSDAILKLFTGSGFANPCSQATTIQYFNLKNSGGIYVQTSFTNLTIVHNQFSNIPCCNGAIPATTGIYFDGAQSTSNTAQVLTNTLVQWNTIGDSASCLSPVSAFADTSSPEGDGSAGNCNGLILSTSVNGLTIKNNNFVHVSEGMHTTCPGGGHPGGGQPCEPSSNGVSTRNVDMEFNDFAQNHRINFEEQPETTSGLIWKNNSVHDMINPTGFSFGLSYACCASGGTSPFLNVSNNLIILNTPPVGRYGYGIEAWGKSSTFSHNMVQSGVFSAFAQGIAWGNGAGAPASTFDFTFNYVCGTWTGYPNNLSQYISSENVVNSNFVPPTTGSNYQPSCAVTRSQIPTISPTPTGTYSVPISVTLTDNGFTSGAVALGNTSIYYTIDGSTPTTASTRCDSPCTPPPVAPGTTVNAIGMWGAINQPRSYANGFGFTSSSVQSAHYSAGSTPTLTGITVALQGGGTSVQVGKSVQVISTCNYASVPATQCGPTADGFGTLANTYISSNTTDATITNTGVVNALVAGSSNITAKAGSFTSPVFALTVTPAAPVLVGANLSCPSPLSIGQTASCTMLCNYTGPQQFNCTSVPDANGNVASGWNSSAPSIASVSGPVVTGNLAGSATISATVGSFTPTAIVQVTGSTPPPATLTNVTVTCPPGSVTVGSTASCKATCGYSDFTTADCTVMDGQGSLAGSWTSSVTADATINSTTGVVTGVAAGSTSIQTTAVNGATTVMSTPITLPVVAAPTSIVLGNNQFNFIGFTSANYINATYAVTGTSPGGYTASTCSFYLPTGTTYSAGSKWDCGVILAPTPTTQASSWLCHATYTTTGTTSDVGFHSLSISGCGTLPASTGYWVSVDTNETTPSQPGQGFWNCGSSCTGSAPSSGNGTYACRYISATYGVYTGMSTTMAGICGSVSPQVQAAQYVVLQTPTPTLVGCGISPGGFANTLVVGGSFTFSAFCNYSDGSGYQAYPGATPYGDTVINWTSDTPAVMTIGDIGGSNPGVATGITAGFANAQATITGGRLSRQWGVTINAAPVSIPTSSSKVFSR